MAMTTNTSVISQCCAMNSSLVQASPVVLVGPTTLPPLSSKLSLSSLVWRAVQLDAGARQTAAHRGTDAGAPFGSTGGGSVPDPPVSVERDFCQREDL